MTFTGTPSGSTNTPILVLKSGKLRLRRNGSRSGLRHPTPPWRFRPGSQGVRGSGRECHGRAVSRPKEIVRARPQSARRSSQASHRDLRRHIAGILLALRIDREIAHRDELADRDLPDDDFVRRSEERRRLGVLAREEYYSVGGGFVVQAGAVAGTGSTRAEPPYEFNSGTRLLEHGRSQDSKSTS